MVSASRAYTASTSLVFIGVEVASVGQTDDVLSSSTRGAFIGKGGSSSMMPDQTEALVFVFADRSNAKLIC